MALHRIKVRKSDKYKLGKNGAQDAALKIGGTVTSAGPKSYDCAVNSRDSSSKVVILA